MRRPGRRLGSVFEFQLACWVAMARLATAAAILAVAAATAAVDDAGAEWGFVDQIAVSDVSEKPGSNSDCSAPTATEKLEHSAPAA